MQFSSPQVMKIVFSQEKSPPGSETFCCWWYDTPNRVLPGFFVYEVCTWNLTIIVRHMGCFSL